MTSINWLQPGNVGLVPNLQISRILYHPEWPSKTVLFERVLQTEKLMGKSGLNLSQNSFLISTSQKVRVRLSFERVYGNQTDKDISHDRSPQSATPRSKEGRAIAII